MNTASRTLSVVGRVEPDVGAASRRPLNSPATTRIPGGYDPCAPGFPELNSRQARPGGSESAEGSVGDAHDAGADVAAGEEIDEGLRCGLQSRPLVDQRHELAPSIDARNWRRASA